MRGGAWFAALVFANISAGALAQKSDFAATKPAVPPTPQSRPILPPPEFDHFYNGDLTIRIVPDLVSLQAACSMPDRPNILACAWHNARSCVIYMVEDRVMREKGWNTGLLLRHEIGHCNGWPPDHPRVRSLPQPVTQFVPSEQRIGR